MARNEPQTAGNLSTRESGVNERTKFSVFEGSSRYKGTPVRVTASWKLGFETSRLFDRECPDQPGAWLEFTDDKDSCPETKKNRDAPGRHDKEADVFVTGR